MVMIDRDHVEQEQEFWEVMLIVAASEGEDVHIPGLMLQVQAQVQDGHAHGHNHEQVEVEEELPVAEQDVQGGFDIEEEQVQVQVQEGVQSVGASGYPVSVHHVLSVEPEPDAMQRYLEGSGP